jgi:hypothetical protein
MIRTITKLFVKPVMIKIMAGLSILVMCIAFLHLLTLPNTSDINVFNKHIVTPLDTNFIPYRASCVKEYPYEKSIP